MLYITTFIIFILNLLFARNKKMLVIDFIFLFILLGWSEGSYDTEIYKLRYINPEEYKSFTEPLFDFIVNFFNKIGFSYRLFFIVSAIFELSLIIKFVKKHTQNFGFVLAVFIIFPMITLFVQMRFLLAFTIVLYFGFDKLITHEKKYFIKYIIAILIATMIHYSSIYYIIFLAADLFNTKKIIILTAIATLILSSVTFFSPILNIITSIIGERKVEILLVGSTNVEGNFGRSVFILFIVLGYLLIYYLFLKNNICKSEDKRFVDITAKCNILSLTTLPLVYLMSSGFYRINQSLLILNYIAISKFLVYKKKGIFTVNELCIIIFTLIYAIILFFMMYHTEEIYNLVIYPFFEQNQFLR